MKGLVIDEPWIGLILRGEKIWEMRKTACHHRGRIALIRKGSGQVVGVADVVGSLSALSSPQAYAESQPKHRIPSDRQGQAFADGWRTPWVLSNARPLVSPVPYKHPFGAVIWVNLDADVARAVEARAGSVEEKQEAPAPRRAGPGSVGMGDGAVPAQPSLLRRLLPWRKEEARGPNKTSPELIAGVETPLRGVEPPGAGCVVKLTGGNVRNNHFYLPLDFFPADAIGGSNRSELASRVISVTFSPGSTVETDIDGTKRILRARGAVADFFARAGLAEGDSVHLRSTGPYCYHVSKATNA